jgi:hypothetical protein
MASDGELDRNAILEKYYCPICLIIIYFVLFIYLIRFASIKRMHDEVGKKQTEDYQKRLQKLKEEEVSFLVQVFL